MKRIIVCLATLFVAVSAHAQFDGAVGTEGCQAISLHDSRIQSWAFGVEVQRGYQQNSTTNFASYGQPYMAQGLPDSTTTTAVALGEGGVALVTFEAPITDGEGVDFCVFENGFTSTYLEIAFVEVSSDGEHFYRFPATSYTTSSSLAPELMNNLAGKYEVGWGTPFDLAEIDDDEFFDRNNVRFVRLVDVIGGVDTDSQGNIIYNAQSGGWATGFDFTGLGVIDQGEAYQVADFEGLLTNADSHEIISADNGTIDSEGNYRLSYLSGGLSFEALGLYDGMFACGFGPSNHTTDNQPYYSAQSLMGLENPASTYMVGYYSDWAGTAEHNVIKREDNTAFSPIGVYVNNSSSAYSYMSSANFPQNNYFLNIIATGYDENGAVTSDVSYPLADANGIVGEWKYMDLTSLGECHKVIFTLSSNDDSGYGINVPAYFCIDAFSYYSTTDPGDDVEIIAPVVTTLAATEITHSSARLNGSIEIGNEEITAQGFKYKATASEEWITISATGENMTATIEGLEADIAYEFKAFATTESGIVEGDVVSFNTLSGIKDIVKDSINVKVYPNPASSKTNICVNGLDNKATITVSDMQGNIILSNQINNETYELNVENYASGVYFIKITSENIVKTQKLIVK
jgi:hypothetical protein